MVMATEPRMPCYKLGIRFGRPGVVKRVLASERTAFYFAVLQEEEVGVGDPIRTHRKKQRQFKTQRCHRTLYHEKHNIGLLRRAIEVATLPES